MGDDIRAGDVVVCVDATTALPTMGWDACHALKRLRVGRHYRVVAVAESWNPVEPALILAGLSNSDINPLWRDTWRAWRFRKLDAAEDCFTKAMQELRPLETTREIHRCRDEVGL